MKIVEADNQLYYIDPARYIERHFLPKRVSCEHCKSKVELDFVSDLRPEYHSGVWNLYFKCLVCSKIQKFYVSHLEQGKMVVAYYVNQLPRKQRIFAELRVPVLACALAMLVVGGLIASAVVFGPEVVIGIIMIAMIVGLFALLASS